MNEAEEEKQRCIDADRRDAVQFVLLHLIMSDVENIPVHFTFELVQYLSWPIKPHSWL